MVPRPLPIILSPNYSFHEYRARQNAKYFAAPLSLSEKVYRFVKMHKDDLAKIFQKIFLRFSVVNYSDKNKKLSMRSGRAGPRLFPLEKGAKEHFARHFGSGKRGCTIKPVRRTFPNSTPHGVSNTWKGSFLPSGQKFPHEPRFQILQVLPRPSASVLRCI